MSGFKTIKIRATGQVTEMVPDIARALIGSGMAEEVKTESMAVAPAAERVVAPAQSGPTMKTLGSRRR